MTAHPGSAGVLARAHRRAEEGAPGRLGEGASLDLAGTLALARRQWPLVATVASAFVLVALVYGLAARSCYTASAAIVIDARKTGLLANPPVVGDPVLDAGGIESQVEILRSESVALAVVRGLGLVGDPDLGGGGLLGAVLGDLARDFVGALGELAGGIAEPSASAASERERAAVEALQGALRVKRLGLSYAIQIDATTAAPPKSAAIANAVAEAYMAGEAEVRTAATRRARDWLEGRLRELREQASAAERAVQDFRSAHGLVETGRGLVNEQQLGDLNAQLAAARAATAEAGAKLARIEAVVRREADRGEADRGSRGGEAGMPDAAVAEALRSDIVARLRAQYLDLQARHADWAVRYGAEHAATANLRGQMREIRGAILDEVRRIAETARGDLAVARAREEALRGGIAALVEEAGATGRAQVRLREFESAAQSSRALHDTFLQRFLEATQQQTLPSGEARLITAATPPLARNWPRFSILLPAGLVLGLLAGIGAAFAHERLDPTLRDAGEAEALTGAPCLGVAPRIVAPGSRGLGRILSRAEPDAASLARHALDAPRSRFADALRGVIVAVDAGGPARSPRVLGIVSARPGEGRTTLAVNLARLAAREGRRVLLVDADPHRSGLTRMILPGARTGVIEVLEGESSLAQAVRVDPATGLRVLPAARAERVARGADLLASRAMAALVDAARADHDLVVLDLPPLGPTTGARAAADLVDGLVLAAAWGDTPREALREALDGADLPPGRLIGTILNKTDLAALRRRERYGSPRRA